MAGDDRRSGAKAYTVPPTNPFVNRKGARPEIWAYGLRNPWRFSFDRATHDLLVSFAEDRNGELYALSLADGIYRLTAVS